MEWLAPRLPLPIGVQQIAILRVFPVHLSAFWAVFACFPGEVSTFIAPVADFVDTCSSRDSRGFSAGH
jgi:hypothetical protein